jgi:hypothetical protein
MFIHFSDLKKDMSSEIRKIATFLAIQINEETWTPIASWRGSAIAEFALVFCVVGFIS